MKLKQTIFVVTSLIIVAACFTIAVSEYNNHKVTALAAQNSAVTTANNTLKEHDAVNAKAIANANTAIANLTAQKLSVCTSLKTTKVVNPNCN